ncbi:MAG: phosphoglycerate kinase [Candidatus Yonathbacteria bacterium]|nr:phosphoglycerate kinase [Candidatus Yonathbacteria bacterium]
MTVPSVKDAKVAGKRVLVRVDFNVPMTDDGKVASDTRIIETLPTIALLLKRKATVVLVSHLGRPDGKVDPKYTMAPVARRLEHYLARKVHLIPDFWQKKAADYVRKLPKNSLVLCENVRYHIGEEHNDPAFAKSLADLAELYVNDAFGTAHRAHASTVGVTAYLPSYAGLLMEKEVYMIGKAITKPRRPLLVIIGGGKTPEKIRVIDRLLEIADTIYLGGAIANTFFATWGISVGVSKVDHEMIEMARQVLWKATRVHCSLMLPNDVVVTNGSRETKPFVLPYNEVPLALGIFDIGPQSIKELEGHIRGSKTIIWNGPMGMYEDERFTTGTKATLAAIAKSGAESVIGGGDTISMIKDKTLVKKISHISTGGGAMLEYLEKGTLPGIEALKNGHKKNSH